MEAAAPLAEGEALAGASACESVFAAGFAWAVFVDGFLAGAALASGFAGVEAAEESCVALEAGACCAPGVEACWARAGVKTAPASRVVRAKALIKVDT